MTLFGSSSLIVDPILSNKVPSYPQKKDDAESK
jgi:hypothetical protein